MYVAHIKVGPKVPLIFLIFKIISDVLKLCFEKITKNLGTIFYIYAMLILSE